MLFYYFHGSPLDFYGATACNAMHGIGFSVSLSVRPSVHMSVKRVHCEGLGYCLERLTCFENNA